MGSHGHYTRYVDQHKTYSSLNFSLKWPTLAALSQTHLSLVVNENKNPL
jgi:hypothetical protein